VLVEKKLIINKAWIKKVQKLAGLETAEETYDFFLRHKRRAFDDEQWAKITRAMEEVLQDEKKSN